MNRFFWVKVFIDLFRLEWIFSGVESVDTVGRLDVQHLIYWQGQRYGGSPTTLVGVQPAPPCPQGSRNSSGHWVTNRSKSCSVKRSLKTFYDTFFFFFFFFIRFLLVIGGLGGALVHNLFLLPLYDSTLGGFCAFLFWVRTWGVLSCCCLIVTRS
jgi:hypothetical protein